MSFTKLFETAKLGSVELSNRIIMAPLTRCRATMPGWVPNALMAEYYAQRASMGLVITEATMVTNHSAFNSEGALYNKEQADGWKLTTDAVHAAGGKIFVQLYHPGGAAHSSNMEGRQPVASSAQAIGGGHQIGAEFTATGAKADYETPKALETAEIPQIVELFVNAAKLAKEAGFDGVEIHGANGYLLDNFLRSTFNNRTDQYGGSLENRARLLLEVVEAVAKVFPVEQIGVRLSPLNSYQGMKDEDPIKLTEFVSAKLDALKIGYLHLMRADFFQAQTGDVLTPARANFKNGLLMLNMGLTPEEAEEGIAKGSYDLACFGGKALANPDLPARIKAGAKLNDVDWATTYTKDAKGYTDYPYLE